MGKFGKMDCMGKKGNLYKGLAVNTGNLLPIGIIYKDILYGEDRKFPNTDRDGVYEH
jgi:hypothetical protein